MKATVIHAAGDLRVEEFVLQDLMPDEVRVRVRAGGICGSDLHYFQHGGFGAVRLNEPMVLGHEVAGVIEAIGSDVTNVTVGDHVAINPSLPCDTCRYCLAGMPNQCLEMRFYGSAMRNPHVQGAFREQLVCKARQAIFVPKDLPFTSAAFAEPLAVCLHAVHRAGPMLGARVLVSGVGPIGALAVLAARHAGAREVVATDLLDEPLAAVAGIGADRVHNVRDNPEALDDYMRDKGHFDVVFEASGSPVALKTAAMVARPQGVIMQIGLGGDVALPMNLIVGKELSLRGSFRFHDEFAWAAGFIASGAIDVAPLLTEVVPMDEAQRAFELAGDRRRAMKVQLAI